VNTTSSAVKGVPSWKRTFLRSLNSHVRSSIAFQEVASAGTSFWLASRRISGSKMCCSSEFVGREVVVVRIDRGDRGLQADGDLALLLRVRERNARPQSARPPRCEACGTWNLLVDACGRGPARGGPMIPWPREPGERFEAMLAQGKDNALLRFTLGSHYLKEGDAGRGARTCRRRSRTMPELLGGVEAARQGARGARGVTGGDRRLSHGHRGRGDAAATSRLPRRCGVPARARRRTAARA
jgi:hypothetical protein